jgi:hypothetical protein
MSKENFENCLAIGEQSEYEFKEILEDLGFEVEKSNSSEYDLKAGGKTFEIKTDLLHTMTGNVAIELDKCINGGNSGLSITKSDFYVYKLIRDKYFYLIETDELRKFINENDFRIEFGGDRNDYRVVLIPSALFKQICEKIPRKILTELNSKYLKKGIIFEKD